MVRRSAIVSADSRRRFLASNSGFLTIRCEVMNLGQLPFPRRCFSGGWRGPRGAVRSARVEGGGDKGPGGLGSSAISSLARAERPARSRWRSPRPDRPAPAIPPVGGEPAQQSIFGNRRRRCAQRRRRCPRSDAASRTRRANAPARPLRMARTISAAWPARGVRDRCTSARCVQACLRE